MRNLLFGIFLLLGLGGYSQKYETSQGDLANIRAIKSYKVSFEYPQDMTIPGYSSEQIFLEQHGKNLKRKDKVYANSFHELWTEQRVTTFEPTFIQEFNAFRLPNRHIAVSRNYKEARYSMKVRFEHMYPGYEDLVWDKPAEIKVTIEFRDSKAPNVILFATKTVKVRGTKNGDIFDKMKTAYGALGSWTAKFLCRNT